ncbi:NAD(P)-binding protein [Thozetella sp. PMI_491]|nr:NAD(P)-binding protein [Thozetella sp. PMI_491]
MGPPAWMIGSYIRSQFFTRLPKPTRSFAGQTIIVTGSSAGLGLEAARTFVHLDATRVILAVRSPQKGHQAAESIRKSTGNLNTIIEVWELDLCKYDSVLAFAYRANRSLDRLDVVVENAGGSTRKFERAEDNERTITVNFVSTMLLGLLLLPNLRETSIKLDKDVVLTFVGSHMHWLAKFDERNADDILAQLANESNANMQDSPGSVATLVNRGSSSVKEEIYHWCFDHLLGRRPEEGARTLVWAAYGGRETDGKYLDDCKVSE